VSLALPKKHLKMTQSQQTNTSVTRRRNPHLEGLLAVVDLVLAYLFLLSALDTGSLLQYGISFVALGLGIRSLLVVAKAIARHRKAHHN
jgi:hypothetical protein